MLHRFFHFLTVAVLIAFVVGSARPGTHRILCPGCFGLTEIAPRIWTDRPSDADRVLSLTRTARATVADFFGGELRQPNIILCSTRACARDFGIRGNGLSMAHVGIIVSPGGLTLGTLTHEMTHFRLHRALGLRNILQQPYPTWFDEGLATHVANHPKRPGAISNAARQRVREVERFWQWDDAYREIGVGTAYTAAAAEVAAIEQTAGRAGLIELINRAEAGEPFNTVFNQIMTR